jgi:predicted phage baseplate assembly protein
VEAVNADIVREEIVGISEGVAAQRFPLQHRPVVRSVTGYVVEVSTIEGWQEWSQVDGFGESGPDDRHFLIEEATGEIVFGPGIRETDGTVRQYGKVPEKGGAIRIREYRVGGGSAGIAAARTLTTMRSQIPFVRSVTNRSGALGGLDAETVDNAKIRGPMLLRSRNRAVTQRDYAMVQVIILFVALVVSLSNLIVDLLYGVMDPRVRYD